MSFDCWRRKFAADRSLFFEVLSLPTACNEIGRVYLQENFTQLNYPSSSARVGNPTMSYSRLFTLTLLALIGFAANPLLARLALKETAIDPASFTTIRLVSGSLALVLIVRLLNARSGAPGDWRSALALFAYAAALSYAYVTLDAAAGTLILFGAVQATMIIAGLIAGERLDARQIVGLAVALAGLVFLLLPGLSAPPLFGSTLMLASGIAWGIYSQRGRADRHDRNKFRARCTHDDRSQRSDTAVGATRSEGSGMRPRFRRSRVRSGLRGMVRSAA